MCPESHPNLDPVDTRRGLAEVSAAGVTSGQRRRAPLIILIIALMMLWPALLNGGPFHHPDTPSYIRSAAAAAYRVFGLKTAWTNEYIRLYQTSEGVSGTAAAVSPQAELPVTLNGRSIYYGIFAYLAYLAGTFWIVAAVQSLLTAASLYLTVNLVARATSGTVRASHLLLIGLITAAATSAGYDSTRVMPDIFTGIGFLAEANLLFLWTWQARAERSFWVCMLAYAQLVHSANIMLFGALLAVSLGYAYWRRAPLGIPQISSVVGCVAIGLLGQAGFSQTVKATTGAPPVRPPFIAMRLIADGPGYVYLEEHCSTEKYLYCRVLSQRNPQSDTLLWSEDPRQSLFRGLSPDEQRVSAFQQRNFVTAVILDQPLPVMAVAAKNTLVQLLSLDLVNFNYSEGNRERFEKTTPPAVLDRMKLTRAYNNNMPVTAVEAATALLSCVCVAFLIFFFFRDRHQQSRQQMRAYCLCIFAAILINAVICGALSGPKGRYQMRLIWVLPVIAGAVACYSRTVPPSGRRKAIRTDDLQLTG
jgi:hypothetical protein